MLAFVYDCYMIYSNPTGVIMKYIVVLALLFQTTYAYSQQWGNPENQMLNSTITDFFYYATKDPTPFSDPNSLRNAEYHATISDNYHDETERISEMVRQQRLLQQQQMMRQYRYYRPYRCYSSGPGLMMP